MPVAFGPMPAQGRLLLASDGLVDYVPHEEVQTLALEAEPEEAARRLVERPRLRNGDWPDDVAVVLVDFSRSG